MPPNLRQFTLELCVPPEVFGLRHEMKLCRLEVLTAVWLKTGILGCDAVLLGEWFQLFQMIRKLLDHWRWRHVDHWACKAVYVVKLSSLAAALVSLHENNSHIFGRRTAGRSRRRWLDAVDRDGKRVLKGRNWRRWAEDWDDWRWRIEEAKIQVAVYCHRRRIFICI